MPVAELPIDRIRRYAGWPTAGPSDDKLLLKMRTAKYSGAGPVTAREQQFMPPLLSVSVHELGHVDWVSWTREAAKLPLNMSRQPSAKAPLGVLLSVCLDTTVLWRSSRCRHHHGARTMAVFSSHVQAYKQCTR